MTLEYDKAKAYVDTHTEDIENELEELANEFLLKNFDMRLRIPINVNGRLTRSLGRFRSYVGGASVNIEISKTILIDAHLKDDTTHLYGTLYHECVHYALHEQGIPNDDSDREFIQSCNSLNVPLTGTIRIPKKIHVYECEEGHFIKSNTRFKDSQYVCGKCKGALKYKEQIVA